MNLIDADKLTDLAQALVAAGYRVVAPLCDEDAVRLKVWSPGAVIDLATIPANSAKEFLFPATETIGRYALDGRDFTTEPVPIAAPRTVLLAVRPCDVAGLAVLDAVFNPDQASLPGDCRDAFYIARREATTVVALVCPASDAECFCTSVGGAPDSTRGADAVLQSADGGRRFALLPVTAKGAALVEAAGSALKEGEAALDPPASVAERFDAAAVTEWLGSGFESPLWQEWALACLGCGACAHVCPTCHCFDIQDEATRREAVRLRNWDSCAMALFTAHAGGHNPRPTQVERWRQRVMHKFRYFPERFGLLACTGCGRCGRLCPAAVTMGEACRRIAEAAKAAKADAK